MKIYTLHSDSHEVLFNEWFKPSLEITNPNSTLFKLKTPQVCKSGNYMDVGWVETMIHKNEFIINSLNESEENEIIMHCDVDIQFFKNIDESLNKSLFDTYDILCQADTPHTACYGVMFIKNNTKTKNIFNNILNLVKDTTNPHVDNDQNIFNRIYRNFDIKLGLLGHEYYSIWRDTGGYVWEPNMGIKNQIPKDLVLHHANYTVGVDNKILLMKQVKDSQS